MYLAYLNDDIPWVRFIGPVSKIGVVVMFDATVIQSCHGVLLHTCLDIHSPVNKITTIHPPKKFTHYDYGDD